MTRHVGPSRRQCGIVIAAPSSGAGKTLVTLGLLRALTRRGRDVRAAKCGPDYIDPAFHQAACGHSSVNLDAWAMDGENLRYRAAAQGGELLIIEGAMGVLDAAPDGRGSPADLAAALGLPIVLVLDVAKTGQSAVLAPAGLMAVRPDLPLAGVILNRIGSERHADLARKPLEAAGVTVFGALPRDGHLTLPERHLGLVQAHEMPALDACLERAADRVEAGVDIDALAAASLSLEPATDRPPALPPIGQRIALARDTAFSFAYPHLMTDWRRDGAEIMPFSPLADQTPDEDADAVFLPGGYPELHAGQLAAAKNFQNGLSHAARRGALIYGECGGYMVLGDALIDAGGITHRMCGLLPLVTSFAQRKLTLGYRRLTPIKGAPWTGPLRGHEFHYATIVSEGRASRLFEASDASGTPVSPMGLRLDAISGSFAHLIAPGT